MVPESASSKDEVWGQKAMMNSPAVLREKLDGLCDENMNNEPQSVH